MSRSFLRTSRSGFIGERQLNAHFFHSASFTRNSTCVNHMNMFPHFDGSRMLIWTMHRSFATRVLLLDRTTPSEDNGGCAEQANTSVLERTCEFDPLTAEKLVRISKYRFLRARLRMKNLVQIPMQEFLDECTQHIGMTNAEAHACLRDFNDAGLIVVVRDLVFLYPFAVLSSFHQSIGVSSDYSAPLRSRRDAIDRALKVLGEEKEAIDARIKLKRNRFWSYVALYSAIQMFIVCHFTFIDFDWDIMEPVSYFLTSGTAIVLYGWFLYHGAESSFEHVDGQVLTNALKKEYARSKFPYARWAELSEERKQVDLEIQKIEEWLRVQG